MTTEDFMTVHNDIELRQYLVNVAKAFSKNAETQKDLLQEAWLRISLCDAQKTCEYYREQGFKAMHTYYRKECRHDRLERHGKQYKKEYDRVRYIKKKHYIVHKS